MIQKMHADSKRSILFKKYSQHQLEKAHIRLEEAISQLSRLRDSIKELQMQIDTLFDKVNRYINQPKLEIRTVASTNALIIHKQQQKLELEQLAEETELKIKQLSKEFRQVKAEDDFVNELQITHSQKIQRYKDAQMDKSSLEIHVARRERK